MYKRVGILGHPLRPTTGEACALVEQGFRTRGVDTWSSRVWDAESVRAQVAESDLIVAIGGDGSMLRAARACSEFNIPIFGINAGHLGFLTEVGLGEWSAALDPLLAGEYWIEERMMIRSELWREEECLHRDDALNDVVVSRGAVAKAILLDAYIDDYWTTQYNADGLIIATPTGSTAYALAVGGPILPPELKNILVVPVAPHLSLDRPLVLSEGARVEVVIGARTQNEAMLTIDGESVGAILQPGDSVLVQASEHVSRFVRLREPNYFYRSLLDRMEPRIPVRRENDRGTRRGARNGGKREQKTVEEYRD